MFEFLNSLSEAWKTALATLTVGLLVFIATMLTLIFSTRNNRLNYKLLLQKDKAEKQKSYNRVLGSFLKVYHSYLKHNLLFNENGQQYIPDNQLIIITDKIDNLTRDIKSFRKTVDEESEILPEITLSLHSILDLLDRFEIFSSEISNDIKFQNTEITKLVLQRAQNFAVKEILDEMFQDLIEQIAIKAEVSNNFLNDIKEYNSETYEEKSLENQQHIFKRFLESLSRQIGKEIKVEDLH